MNKEQLYKSARHLFNKMMEQSACAWWTPDGITYSVGISNVEKEIFDEYKKDFPNILVFAKTDTLDVQVSVYPFTEWRTLKDFESYDEPQAVTGIRLSLPDTLANKTFTVDEKNYTFISIDIPTQSPGIKMFAIEGF